MNFFNLQIIFEPIFIYKPLNTINMYYSPLIFYVFLYLNTFQWFNSTWKFLRIKIRSLRCYI